MRYRVAKAYNSDAIVAVEEDNYQYGDYNGIGTWCDWTFPVLPLPIEDMTNSDIIWINEDNTWFERAIPSFGWKLQ